MIGARTLTQEPALSGGQQINLSDRRLGGRTQLFLFGGCATGLAGLLRYGRGRLVGTGTISR